jgi:hypothetical protein
MAPMERFNSSAASPAHTPTVAAMRNISNFSFTRKISHLAGARHIFEKSILLLPPQW